MTKQIAATYFVGSIDGDFAKTKDELLAGVGTDWSDVQYMPVFDSDDDEIGRVDPKTGKFEAHVNPATGRAYDPAFV